MFGIVKKIRKKIAKTKNSFIGKIAEAIKLRGKIDEDLFEDLEEILIEADIGVDLSLDILDKLRDEVRVQKITDTGKIQKILEEIIKKILLEEYSDTEDIFDVEENKTSIFLIIGVNGAGKTTSIGKIAKKFRDKGKSVLLVAGDTFRAGAINQLQIWADRVKVPIMKQQPGSDPSSVVYDGVRKALSEKIDVVLIDTAGRQHNKVNLMKELSKIERTIKKLTPEGPDETILVLDATTGQNAISQAKLFNEVAPVSGIVLTKLDGTAKGGVIISIKHKLDIPVKMIGIGEKVEDLQPFDPKDFIEALFE